MINDINLENILFLDIETVPASPSYNDLPERFRKLWDRKSEHIKREPEDTPETLFPRAGIYAEFGRIVCISAGFFRNESFRIKSFHGDNEKELLVDFSALLSKNYNAPDKILCAHNGKEFDFPYMARRILINGLPIPWILDTHGKKPWEVTHLDTMELWKFGDHKNYTSLELLAAVFDIPTPKDDIDGSDVFRIYYQEHDLERIRTYCQKDVVTIAQIFLKYLHRPLLDKDKIFYVD